MNAARAFSVLAASVSLAFTLACGLPKSSDALPAGWGYELVSPADQLGTDLDFAAGSADGNHAWIASVMPLIGESHTGNMTSIESVRTASGWKVSDLADSTTNTNDSFQLVARSADSSSTVVARCVETLIGCDQYFKYERVGSDGSRSVMLDDAPVQLKEGPPQLGAASDDLSTLFFGTFPNTRPLLPQDTHSKGGGLYATHEGRLEYIGYDEKGAVLACGAVLANGRSGAGFEQSGISADGSTAVYESPHPESGCAVPTDVYVRREGRSIDISAPRDAEPDEGATYLGNSRDGNTVYFLTKSRLLASDTDSLADIYAYDVPSETLTRITEGGDVSDAVVSPGGDYVYFSAFSALAGQGVSGRLNMYVWHAGAIRYIATAPSGSVFVLGGAMNSAFPSPVTPDGTHLLFMASADFTGKPLGKTMQWFQYDYSSDGISCVSCPSDGSSPAFDVVAPTATPTGNADQRWQADDGRIVVFESKNALVPQDVNGQPDVYMWREGELSLISSGRSSRESQLVSTDAAGDNVFFIATDRLTPAIEQDNSKLYDARLGGGFPFVAPVAPCEGEECQPPPSAPPSVLAPATIAFGGAGNATAGVEAAASKKAKSVSSAQRLRAALKVCRSRHVASRRRKCEASARKRYRKATKARGSK